MAQYEIKKCDITIECGATFTMYFVVRDNNNSLVDLTGSTVEAQLREYAEANDYFEFTATHNGSGGRVTLTMPFEDTAAIPYTSGVYDVYITDQNNDREKYLIGDVNIVPAVTKPVAGEIIYLLSFASENDFPSYGMVRRLYFSHASNHIYRWNGTDYVDIVTDGEAATVEVGDVETLPAGSDATVENVGSLLNAVFDFGIPEGNGIASIEKTGTDVLTDTYTITFTDPSAEAFDFDVTNGKGIVSIAEVVSGLTHTFTVTFNDGDTFTYTLTDGNGIVGIEKTGSTDNVDHYRITFDDGTYFDYDVTNVDTSEFYDKDEIDTLLADKADVGDSYTKDEEDALLADKADSADLGDLASKDTVDWDSDIDNIPSTFPPEAHNHDDRYYTETEMDALLADKADTDDLGTMSAKDTDDYYTKSETDTLLLDKAPVITETASGSIASFSDGSPAPVTALTVDIEPVQDLHGYANPWPAGGGKNKLKIDLSNDSDTVSGLSFAHTDDTFTLSGTASSTYKTFNMATFPVITSGNTYSLSAEVTGTNPKCQITLKYLNANNQAIYSIGVNKNGSYKNSIAFTSEDEVDHCQFIIESLENGGTYNLTAKVQFEQSNTPTDWTPWENICPISGHTSAVVTRTGKNLLDISSFTTGALNPDTGAVVSSTTRTVSPYIFLKSGTYTFSRIARSQDNWSKAVLYDTAKTYVKKIYNNQSTTNTFTLDNDGYIRIGADYIADASDHFQLELGSTASAYEPYQGQQVTIDLDGTRYGGVLDVLTGEMTVDRVGYDMGQLNWAHVSPSGSVVYDYFKVNISGITPNVEKTICSVYPCVSASVVATSGYDNCIAVGGITLFVADSSYTDAQTFKTAVNGQYVVCVLATPLTVQLTPSQMQTLLGTNNIWADTGDTSVTYRADTKLFVQGQIAETLDAVKKAKQIITDVTTEMVAPRNLAEGDYVIVGDDLLKTTATVASGSTLTIGINCVKTTVAEALIALATASE